MILLGHIIYFVGKVQKKNGFVQIVSSNLLFCRQNLHISNKNTTFANVKEQINYIISQLQGFYPREELHELAYWIIEETVGLTRTQLFTQSHSKVDIPNLPQILERLKNHEPMQYSFRFVIFFKNLRFYLSFCKNMC